MSPEALTLQSNVGNATCPSVFPMTQEEIDILGRILGILQRVWKYKQTPGSREGKRGRMEDRKLLQSNSGGVITRE